MNFTRELAQYVTELRYEDLTPNAIEMAKKCVLDFLGCCIGGSEERPAQIMRNVLLTENPATGNVTVFGRESIQTGVLNAAACNGTSAHALDMDDVVNACYGHPGPVVISAALAVAERIEASGKELLTAIAAGYEVMIRVAEAVLPDSYYYWHTTSTSGTFGAAAAAGKLLELDTGQMVHCFGSAGTQAAGLFEFLRDGADSKTLHAGKAAYNGVLAAYLSKNGFTAAQRILEGEKGFCRAMMKEPRLDCITKGLGDNFQIEETSFKPYACCRWIHALINGALSLRDEYLIKTEEVSSISLAAYPTALDITDNSTPKTVYGCKFSMQYCVAAALLFGEVGTEIFCEENIQNKEILRLMSLTNIRAVKISDDAAEVNYSEIEIELRNGTRYQKTIRYALGDPKNPMSFEDMCKKFNDLAGKICCEDQKKALIRFAQTLEIVPNVSLALAKCR
ncbi:MAG: MmgE/PrpD family protein [Clostridiales bacterium]|nr:MmgE/PrpD family protein [Clostridiales bacterium]